MKVASLFAPALAVALAFAAGMQPAHAATVITHTAAIPATVATTVSPGGTSAINFAQFDPALGNLLGVSLSFTATSNTTVNLVNNTPQARTWLITPSSTATLSGNGFTLSDSESAAQSTINLAARFSPSNPRTASLTFGGSYADSDSIASGFTPFLGTGTVGFTFAALNQWAVSGSGGGRSFNPDVYSGSATLEYSYQPLSDVVPEPATWALLISGFAMVGVSLRRGRRGAVQRHSS
jgi:hypothetical protein